MKRELELGEKINVSWDVGEVILVDAKNRGYRIRWSDGLVEFVHQTDLDNLLNRSGR